MTVDRTAERHRYRCAAEMIRAVRDDLLLTQAELADRAELGLSQLCRYEKGRAEPSLPTLRRLLAAVGWAPTFGLEPTSAALDEQLDAGARVWEALGLDTWLVTSRVVWPALEREVPLVVGGELAAGLHGVPIPDPELVVHLRLTHLTAFAAVARAAHCVVGRPGPIGLEEVAEPATREDRLVVYVGAGTLHVVVSDDVPATTVVTVDRRFGREGGSIAVPVVELATLRGSGALGPEAEALAERLVSRC